MSNKAHVSCLNCEAVVARAAVIQCLHRLLRHSSSNILAEQKHLQSSVCVYTAQGVLRHSIECMSPVFWPNTQSL